MNVENCGLRVIFSFNISEIRDKWGIDFLDFSVCDKSQNLHPTGLDGKFRE